MARKKLNLKNKEVQKRIEENPIIENKAFKALVTKAVQPAEPSQKRPD